MSDTLSTTFNLRMQFYRGIPLRLIDRDYSGKKAKRYSINNTNQNVWIPDVFLLLDGTIRPYVDLEFIFTTYNNRHILGLAGVRWGDLSKTYYIKRGGEN